MTASADNKASLFDRVTSSDSTPLKMHCILEGVGRNANADRCYVYMLQDPDGTVYDNRYEWCADGVSPILKLQQGVDLSGYPDLLDAFQNGRVWSFTDVEKLHPKTREWAKSHGIQALISVPFRSRDGVVAGYVGFDFVRTHPNPIPARAVRNLMEAANMISFCLRVRREQERANLTAGMLQEMGVGIWSFELDDGAPPRMYGNKAMDDLLGCDGGNLTPEEYYHAWYDHIHPDHYGEVHETVKNLMEGFHAEVQYPFLHPVLGEMWVRCGGRRDTTYTKGVRIIGRHQDISALLHLQKDASAEISSAQRKADCERDRADRERDVNHALELLVSEHGFTRLLNRLMPLWCRAFGAQWCVLGEFSDGDFQVVHSHSEGGGELLFEPGERLAYLPEVSGQSIVDFQGSDAAREMAKLSREAKVIRGIVSCHSAIIHAHDVCWGSIVLLFRERHELTEDERRFLASTARGIEYALQRREREKR